MKLSERPGPLADLLERHPFLSADGSQLEAEIGVGDGVFGGHGTVQLYENPAGGAEGASCRPVLGAGPHYPAVAHRGYGPVGSVVAPSWRSSVRVSPRIQARQMRPVVSKSKMATPL